MIDPEKFHFPLNHIPQVDLRDWDEIKAWAAELPTEFELDPAVHRRELVPF